MTTPQANGMFDINWCDYCGVVHDDIIVEHCDKGEHCTSTDAGCNASLRVNDHSRKCCICMEEIK